MSFYTFEPIHQKRIWGGSAFRDTFKRDVDPNEKWGESWELVDRPEACSKIASGPEKGQTLHDLWVNQREKIFGTGAPAEKRFPILIKILDAAEKLSLQVHPPAEKAAELNGEPKTEMWYFLETKDDAQIYVGLKKGVTREKFEKAIGTPELAALFHRLKTKPSDVMFLPSGRVHAIGGGNVILEVQQNSDTTYRVDDWGRLDQNGKPRELHVKESLASIRFNDFEPFFTQPHGEKVLECPYFSVQRAFLYPDEYRSWTGDGRSFQYHFLARGELTIESHVFHQGQGWLVSADHPSYELKPGAEGAELVTVQWGR